MESPNPELAALISTGVGMLMILVGVRKSALEWRRRRRLCASCGREILGRDCETCANPR
jgi:hypothetical protein